MAPSSPRSSSTSGASTPVFGSRSPSPSSAAQPRNGSDSHSQQQHAPLRTNREPSDLPFLIRTHQTDGYRAGVSDGKDAAEGVQAAFDAAYPLGAELGFRVGWLLGVLGEHGDGGGDAVDGRRQGATGGAEAIEEARRELSVAALVAEMEAAGVLGSTVGDGGVDEVFIGDVEQEEEREGKRRQEEEEGETRSGDKAWETTGKEVVDALPSIRKWSLYVDELLKSGKDPT